MRALAMSMSRVSTRKPQALTSLTSPLAIALGRNRDHRGVRFSKHVPVIRDERTTKRGRERLAARALDVHHGDQLAIAARGEFLGVVTAHVAGADDGDFQ